MDEIKRKCTIEDISKILNSLPAELKNYFTNQILLKLFTKTEIIRYLLLNFESLNLEKNLIQIPNLNITLLDGDNLKFDENPYSMDILSITELFFYNQLSNFENLLKFNILSIDNLIIKNFKIPYQIDFLFKYCKNLEVESIFSLFDFYIKNYIKNSLLFNKISIVNLTFYKSNLNDFNNLNKLLVNFDNFNINYIIKFVIYDSNDFKHIFKLLNNFKINKSIIKFKFLFFLEISYEKLSKLTRYFDYCTKLLYNQLGNNLIDLKIVLKLLISDNFNFNIIPNSINCEIVEKLIIDSTDDKNYKNIKFYQINDFFQNLKILEIKCDLTINRFTFNTLKNLNNLTKIIFYCDSIDYNWLSLNLPINLKFLKIFQSMKSNNNTILTIPLNLNNLIIETDDSKVNIDFNNFNFFNAKNLKSIIIIDHFISDFQLNLNNLTYIPENLKEIRFHDSDDVLSSLENSYFFLGNLCNKPQLNDIYFNIGIYYSINNASCCSSDDDSLKDDLKFSSPSSSSSMKIPVSNSKCGNCCNLFKIQYFHMFNCRLKTLNLKLKRITNMEKCKLPL